MEGGSSERSHRTNLPHPGSGHPRCTAPRVWMNDLGSSTGRPPIEGSSASRRTQEQLSHHPARSSAGSPTATANNSGKRRQPTNPSPAVPSRQQQVSRKDRSAEDRGPVLAGPVLARSFAQGRTAQDDFERIRSRRRRSLGWAAVRLLDARVGQDGEQVGRPLQILRLPRTRQWRVQELGRTGCGTAAVMSCSEPAPTQ